MTDTTAVRRSHGRGRRGARGGSPATAGRAPNPRPSDCCDIGAGPQSAVARPKVQQPANIVWRQRLSGLSTFAPVPKTVAQTRLSLAPTQTKKYLVQEDEIGAVFFQPGTIRDLLKYHG